MNKNERPSKIVSGYLYAYSPEKIPPNYASRATWRRRGYKILPGTRASGKCEYWTGRAYLLYSLFADIQVVEIRGEKAKERRKQAWQ